MSAVVFQDSFSGTTGVDIASRSPTTLAGDTAQGSLSWTLPSGGTAIKIAGAHAAGVTVTGGTEEYSGGYTLTNAEAKVEFDVAFNTQVDTAYFSALLHRDTSSLSARTCYEARFVQAASNTMSMALYRYAAGTGAQESFNNGIPQANGNTYHVELSSALSGGNLVVSCYLTRTSDGFYLNPSGAFASAARVACMAYTDASPLAKGFGGLTLYDLSYSGGGEAFLVSAYKVTDPNATAGGSATITEQNLPANHAGNVTVHAVGTGTAWSSSTTWTPSGVAGWSVASKTCVDATHYTIVLTGPAALPAAAGATGTLTLTEGVTGATAPTTTVGAPTLAISPTSGTTGTTPTLTLAGANTLWASGTASGLFTVTGGTGASMATPTVTSNAAATDVLTVGSAAGTLTLKDASTGATAAFTASAPTAVTITLSGPAGGNAGPVSGPSEAFTLTPSASSTDTVSLSDGGAGGVFLNAAGAAVTSLTWASSSTPQTFQYVPASAGSRMVSASSGTASVAGSPVTYTAAIGSFVVFVGDSWTFGIGSTTGTSGTARGTHFVGVATVALKGAWAATNLGAQGWTLKNYGTQANANLTDDLAARSWASRFYNPSRPFNVVNVEIGYNDIGSASRTGSQLYADLQTYIAAVKTQHPGWKFVVNTLCSGRSGTPVQVDAEARNFNTLLRAGYASFADGLADPALDPHLAPAASSPYPCDNTTWYYNVLHPAEPGHAAYAAQVVGGLEEVVKANAAAAPVNRLFRIGMQGGFQS